MAEEREYEVVILGSTGFTGKFVAEEVYRIQCEGRRSLRWAAAGRNETKVKACLEASGIEGVDVVVADVNDQESLEALCSRTLVLINCVGPYIRYGEPVVKACINQKCHYVDITGETYFMEKMLYKYGEQAKDAGVYIVSSCGYDCIPNDLGTLLLERKFPGELAYVESYMTTDNTEGFNTGTWESFLLSIRTHGKLTTLRKEHRGERPPKPREKPPQRRFMFYSEVARKWCVLFPGPDRAVVCRSMQYRHETVGTTPYTFHLYFGLKSLCQAIAMVFFFSVLLLLVYTDCGLKLLCKFPRLFSGGVAAKGGPGKKQIENGTFTVYLEGAGYRHQESGERPTSPDSKISVKVRGAEPGYVATSAMLVQSALCLVDEKDALPPNGGVYTPAMAFGNTNIIQNLENTGKVKFEVTQTS